MGREKGDAAVNSNTVLHIVDEEQDGHVWENMESIEVECLHKLNYKIKLKPPTALLVVSSI
jgi:hypothetical protein